MKTKTKLSTRWSTTHMTLADPQFKERYGLQGVDQIFPSPEQTQAYYKLRYHFAKVSQSLRHVGALSSPPKNTVGSLQRQQDEFFQAKGLLHYLEHYGIDPGIHRKRFADKVANVVSKYGFFPIIDKKGRAFVPFCDDQYDMVRYYFDQLIQFIGLVQYHIEFSSYQQTVLTAEQLAQKKPWQQLAFLGIPTFIGPVEQTKKQVIQYYAGMMSRSYFSLHHLEELYQSQQVSIVYEGETITVSDVLLSALLTPYAVIYLGDIQKRSVQDIKLIAGIRKGNRSFTIGNQTHVVDGHGLFVQSVSDASQQEKIQPIDGFVNIVRF